MTVQIPGPKPKFQVTKSNLVHAHWSEMRHMWNWYFANNWIFLLRFTSYYALPFLTCFILRVSKPIKYGFAIIYCGWIPQIIAENILDINKTAFGYLKSNLGNTGLIEFLLLWGNIQTNLAVQPFPLTCLSSNKSCPSVLLMFAVQGPKTLESEKKNITGRSNTYDLNNQKKVLFFLFHSSMTLGARRFFDPLVEGILYALTN